MGYLVFDLQRNLVAAAYIGVQSGGQHLRQHAYGSSAALYPTQKTWMGIARSEGQNRAHELCVDLRQWRGLGGKVFPKARANFVRDHLPYGKFAHGFHVPEHVVEHLVGLLAKAGPILRVERGACHWCGRMHFFGRLRFLSEGSPLSGRLRVLPSTSNRNAIMRRGF